MRFHLGLILAGLLFFAFPNFNLLDILPDFIGCILIMAGLSKLKHIDGNFYDARRNAKYILWISVLRLLLCMWTNSGHRDYVMPFTFIICVLEAIYMISLFRNLYLGAEYTLMRADSDGKGIATGEAFTLSFIFVIVSRVLEFAPHITDIIKQDAELDLSAGASFKMSMAQLKTYVLAASLVCSMIIGIIYFFSTIRTWYGFIKRKGYTSFLGEKYDVFAVTDREVLVSEKLSKIYFLLTFGFIFLADFYIDGINILPTPICIILVFSASCYACKLGKRRVPLIIGILALISSVANYAYMTNVKMGINYHYSIQSFLKQEFHDFAHFKSVIYSAILSMSEFVLTSVLIIICISALCNVFRNEKRRNALTPMKFMPVLPITALFLHCINCVLCTFEGHYSTVFNDTVGDYVRNKAFILNRENYELLIQNQLIVKYEAISSAQSIITALLFICVLLCVLYSASVSRRSEGE